MGKTRAYVTHVLFAVRAGILDETQEALLGCKRLQVISPSLLTGVDLLSKVDAVQPDILVLDMALPAFNEREVLTALSAKKSKPYVVVTAPRQDPYLIGIQKYPAVRAALMELLALSPVLRHVIEGIANGSEYFASSPPNSGFSRDDLVLLALMALGVENFTATQELGWVMDKIYHGQRRLRQKLGATTSAQVIAFAISQGLVGVLTEPPHPRLLRETGS